MTRTWPALLLLSMYSSASNAPVARATVSKGDPLVGCYRMKRAKPASPAAVAQIPMPPPFRLDSVLGTGVFSCGKTRVQWASPPQDYFAAPASWERVGPHSITIWWTNGLGSLQARLEIHGDTLRGTATTYSDVWSRTHPTADVIVSRIPCPPPPADSAALATLVQPGTRRSTLISAANWDSLPIGDTTRVFLQDSTDRIAGRGLVRIRWYVSDTTVATIDSSGLLRGLTIGTATVVAQLPERMGLRNVKVVSRYLAEINGGVDETCGVTQDGQSLCWGGAPPVPTSSGLPTQLQHVPRLTTISVGMSFFCGLDSSGAIYCGGTNAAGQLGLGYINASAEGRVVHAAGVRRFTLVTAGADYACGIASDSTAYCWGSNQFGQLGTSSVSSERCMRLSTLTPCRSSPVQVSAGLHFRDLAAGYRHTCGVLSDATVVCWGNNSDGQLGNGSRRSSAAPVRVVGNMRFSSVTVGGTHTCGVAVNGRGFCWGSNRLGELGVGDDAADHERPTPIAGETTLRSVSATGDNSTCGLTQTGALFCWGMSEGGGVNPLFARDRCTAMGEQSLRCARRPVPQGGGNSFVFLGRSLGGALCALDSAGRPFCWGNGSMSVGNPFACGEPTPPLLVGGGPSSLWPRTKR